MIQYRGEIRAVSGAPLKAPVLSDDTRQGLNSPQITPSIACIESPSGLPCKDRVQRRAEGFFSPDALQGRRRERKRRRPRTGFEVTSRGGSTYTAGVRMNVVNLGVLAELDALAESVLAIVSLLGVATLMLLAWAKAPGRERAAVLEPATVTLPHARLGVQLHPWDLARACRATRAPPCLSLHQTDPAPAPRGRRC